VANLPDVLRQIAQIGKELAPRADQELERVVRELVAEMQGVAPAATGAVLNAD
jgi:hypothetical protein